MTFPVASHVRNPAKYYNRTVQDWHMTQFPHNFLAIDVDLAGFCPRCYSPLYFIEASETAQKPTMAIQRLALLTGSVAILIIHDGTEIVKSKRVAPDPGEWHDGAKAIAKYIHQLRDSHRATCEGHIP